MERARAWLCARYKRGAGAATGYYRDDEGELANWARRSFSHYVMLKIDIADATASEEVSISSAR